MSPSYWAKDETPAMKDNAQNRKSALSVLSKLLGLAFWVAIILLCVIYRDKITAQSIAGMTPKNPAVAIVVMLALFALKSLVVVVHCGILYLAGGLMFRLPTALAVSFAGSVVMTSLPFWLGRRYGAKLVDKNPKLEFLRPSPDKNEWLIAFFSRIVGILPSDIVSLYLGAGKISYARYITGSMAGLLPSIINFTIMGRYLGEMYSPVFRTVLVLEVGRIALSLGVYFALKIKKTVKGKQNG